MGDVKKVTSLHPYQINYTSDLLPEASIISLFILMVSPQSKLVKTPDSNACSFKQKENLNLALRLDICIIIKRVAI